MKIPDELDIKRPDWPDPRELVWELAKELSEPKRNESEGFSAVDFAGVVPRSFVKATVTVATNAWRIHTKLVDSVSGEPREEITKEELKRVRRYVETILEALVNIGLEIKDRTGEIFDYGMPEKVVAAQSQEGLNREQVVETIRPTVYWGHQLVQQGEVVIATPPANSEWKE